MKTETVIDRLVQRLQQSGVDIKPLVESPWIEELESKLGCRFPVSFRSLVRRYRFLRFGLGPIELYANTGSDEEDELRLVVMRDPILSRITREGGYVHFARASTGSYDPVCFDTRAAGSVREYPVVRLDHEAMLCYERLRVIEEIAPSFLQIALEHSNTEQPHAPARAT